MTILALFCLGVLAGAYGRLCLLVVLAFAAVPLPALAGFHGIGLGMAAQLALAHVTFQLGYLAALMSDRRAMS